MNYERFSEVLREKVEEQFDESFEIKVQPIQKNLQKRLSLQIQKKDQRITPAIYLEQYYEDYQKGIEMSDIVSNLIQCYNSSIENMLFDNSDLGQIQDFSFAKDKIYYRLVPFENNSMLTDCPYLRFCDLAIVFYVRLTTMKDKISSYRITNDIMHSWGLTVQSLNELAEKNTPILFPATYESMLGMMKDLCKVDELDTQALFDIPENESNEEEMYILSNTECVNGATCLIYQDMLEKLAEVHKSDLLILPSSIHEVIVLPKRINLGNFKDEEMYKDLCEMVCTVNQTQVSLEDFLSNNVYHYHRDSKQLEVIDSQKYAANLIAN